MKIHMRINTRDVEADVEPRTLLVHFLRETLRLTGTHIGCDTSQCGACTVLLDGDAIKSCTLLAAQANGYEVTTIEGLTPDGTLHPLQAAFQQNHALQCGFCTPGIIMATHELLSKNSILDEQEVRVALEGNRCRCTGYQNIVKAVLCVSAQEDSKHGM